MSLRKTVNEIKHQINNLEFANHNLKIDIEILHNENQILKSAEICAECGKRPEYEIDFEPGIFKRVIENHRIFCICQKNTLQLTNKTFQTALDYWNLDQKSRRLEAKMKAADYIENLKNLPDDVFKNKAK